MRRGMLWLALVLCLCVPMLGASCEATPETEDKTEDVIDKVTPPLKTAAPWLPTPLKEITYGLIGIGAGIQAWISNRRRKRAVTAELAAAQATEMKLRLRDGTQAFGDMIDSLRENDDPEVRTKVEEVLSLFDSYKRKADAITSEAFGWFDRARKRIA